MSSDSDAPEELTAQQGIEKDEEIRKAQIESSARVRREKKERRKKWAERLTPKSNSKSNDEMVDDVEDDVDDDNDLPKHSLASRGTLPDNIVKALAARDKQVFLSDDSEEEKNDDKLMKPKRKKKKTTTLSGVETVILNRLPQPPCVQNSLDFLQARKMRVARSSAVLNNSNQALRLLSSSGLLK